MRSGKPRKHSITKWNVKYVAESGTTAIEYRFGRLNDEIKLSCSHWIKGIRGMKKEEKKVLDAMKKAGKPVRPGDVAKSTDIESKEVSKIIKSLKEQGLVHSPKRCYYAPKDS